jgi:putative transposase
VIARCQQHPTENVKNRLPERLKSVVEKRMRKAYHAVSALAVAHLEALAKELERTHPVPAASLREGLPETLTAPRLKVPPTLARTRAQREQHRVDDLHRPHPLARRAALAGRADGVALVRRRHRRRRQAVPPRQRTHAPRRTRRTLDEHVAAQTIPAVRQHGNVIAT